jgi:hypothetical protein
MEIWPATMLALVALAAYDFLLGKQIKRRWIMTAAFWVLFSILLLSIPTCGGQDRCDGCDTNEGPSISY